MFLQVKHIFTQKKVDQTLRTPSTDSGTDPRQRMKKGEREPKRYREKLEKINTYNSYDLPAKDEKTFGNGSNDRSEDFFKANA